MQRKWQGQRSCYNGVNQSTGCLICIFMQCITEKGYAACRARRKWKRAWSDAFFSQQCLPGVFDVKRLRFRKDKWEKVTWTGHLVQEDKGKPKHLDTEGEAMPTIFSGTALLTVDVSRDVTVSTGQPPLGFLYCFDIHLCTLSNSWGKKKPKH